MGEVSLLNEAFQALTIILDPMRFGYLLLGVMIGLVLGVIPGLGGLVGLSLLLPFTFSMDPYTALAFLLGLQSVIATSDTIPAILFGVPGTVGSAATIMDGYPMARKGEAGRAFGAAFTASLIGGLWGALLLALCIPILRPAMLYIGTPEMAAICVFGLSLAAVLSGGSLLKGLVVACIGLLISTIGEDPQTGTLRWSESIYMWAGLPVVPLALGLFAIPEIADLVIQRNTIARSAGGDTDTSRGQWQGVRDVFRSYYLVLRCSTLGAVLGAVPGIGASVLDWIAYAHAARTEKNAAETFGKGDVRGVIASESANNAKEGGALVPTIVFGVPGSASMALILGAFLAQGIIPGPEMLTERLDITYTAVWSVALANIFGAGILFVFARHLAKVALIRIGILAPTVLVLVFIGAFQGSQQWGDLFTLLVFGLIGFAMKRLRWPRPPLILGFVLGGLIERYMFISVERYGASWIWERPIVVALIFLTLIGVLGPMIRGFKKRHDTEQTRTKSTFGFQPQKLDADLYFAFVLTGLFIAAIIVSSAWEFGAKLMPQITSWTAMMLLVAYVTGILFFKQGIPAAAGSHRSMQSLDKTQGRPDVHFDIVVDFAELSSREILRRAIIYFGWLLFFLGLALSIGLLPATFFFLVFYMRFAGGESWSRTLGIAVGLWALIYVLFHLTLFVPWPQALLGAWFPELRSNAWLNLF